MTTGTLRKVAQLILKGRFGRAARVYHRVFHTSPRFLRDMEAREKWAKENA